MSCVSSQQTIYFSKCKSSDTGCGHRFWTVLVIWYPTTHIPVRQSILSYTVGIKLIVCDRGSGWSWLVGVVICIPDSMLCLTSFLVRHNTICDYACIHQ